MFGVERAAIVKLIVDVIIRMPRGDAEAIALRVLGSLDQAGYEIRQKPEAVLIIGFRN
jgi:hypothetical protein